MSTTQSLDCHLHILQGRNLTVMDRTSSDPFVRVYFMDAAADDDYLFQSRSKSQTVNPKFNEKFHHTITDPQIVARVQMQKDKSESCYFVLRLYDEDGMYGEDAMGFVKVPLVVNNDPTCEWYPVQEGQGELQVKLQVTVVS